MTLPSLGRAGVVGDGAREESVEVGAGVDPRLAWGDAEGVAGAAIGAAVERRGQTGELGEGTTEGHEVAGEGALHAELYREPLEVGDHGELGAHLGPEARLGDEELHGVEAAANLGDARERREEPAAEEARPRARLRLVDLREERSLVVAVDRAHELQVTLRRFVEEERVGDGVGRQARDRNRAPRLAGAGHRHAARRRPPRDCRARAPVLGDPRQDRPRLAFVDRALPIFTHHRPSERRAQVGGDGDRLRSEEHLARIEAHELGERAGGVGRLALQELPGGHVERGDPPRRLPFSTAAR